jgi:hypothetical protein
MIGLNYDKFTTKQKEDNVKIIVIGETQLCAINIDSYLKKRDFFMIINNEKKQGITQFLLGFFMCLAVENSKN